MTQLAGVAGCISEDGTGGLCTDGVALNGAQSVMVAPDGTHVYVWSRVSDAVSVFARDPVSGALAQLAAPDGCVSLTGTGGACSVGTAISGPGGLTVSPDGAHVYVASRTGNAIAAFAREALTGKLTQLAGSDGCVSDDGTGGACSDGTALDGVRGGFGWSADGTSLYAAANDASAVAIFGRDPASGRLSQLAGPPGCVSEDGTGGACTDATALGFAQSLVVSGDGLYVYVASEVSDAVAAFSRQLPPTCRSASVTVPRSGKAYVHLACEDPNGDPITRAVVSQPLNGQLSALDTTRNTVSYKPSSGFTGNDAITYSASDGGATSTLATISLRVVGPGSAEARSLRCKGRPATIVGSEVGDNIRGTKRRNVVVARGGDDVVNTLGGNDAACLGGGDDTARGGAGNDFLSGGAGNDLLRGMIGRDVATGGSGDDRLEGGANNDRLLGGPGLDFLIGSGGLDRLIAGSGNDRLLGGRGNDVLRGGPGIDRGVGGPGQDTCFVERATLC